MPIQLTAERHRQRRSLSKYRKVGGNTWIINISDKHGSVRPIDLVSRDPARLREFESKEAALAFEEECHKEAQKLRVARENWSQYRYIPRKLLKFPEDQRPLIEGPVICQQEVVAGRQSVQHTADAGKKRVNAACGEGLERHNAAGMTAIRKAKPAKIA